MTTLEVLLDCSLRERSRSANSASRRFGSAFDAVGGGVSRVCFEASYGSSYEITLNCLPFVRNFSMALDQAKVRSVAR